jgi:hypothetical protein
VRYSALESEPRKRPAILVTTAEAPPPGYLIRAEEAQTGVKICLDLDNPDPLVWARNQEPLTGPDRFPWILSDIAPVPRPRWQRTRDAGLAAPQAGDLQIHE